MNTNPSGSRQKLIQATIGLIAAKGFENTGINEILSAARVAKSNFYYHFASKEELCLTALEAMMEHYFEEVIRKTLLNTSMEPAHRLEAFCRGITSKMISNCCKAGCPFINLGNETSDFYPTFRAKIQEINQRQLDAIAQCIEDGIAAGAFRPDLDSMAVAQFVMAEINGSILMSKIYREGNILENNFRTLFAILTK